MATTEALQDGSQYCRDCGGLASTRDNKPFCDNRSPLKHCRVLDADDRCYCEHCGGHHPGPAQCLTCRRSPAGQSQRRRDALECDDVPDALEDEALETALGRRQGDADRLPRTGLVPWWK